VWAAYCQPEANIRPPTNSFSLARISYLNISGDAPSSFKSGAVTGEWFWYRSGIHRIGITLHLTAIVPAGVLMVFQFVPIIRYKAILVHRINGYLIILLATLGNVGAIMIARRAFGGTLATQSAVGYLAMFTTISVALAYYNIKKLQIDQHRAWMLRAMFALGTIIRCVLSWHLLRESSHLSGTIPPL
jgi:uncharacterized membrane protein